MERPEDKLTESVIQDLRDRADRGWKKYNTTLQGNNKDNMLQHAYEEALDLAQYLKKEITTREVIQSLIEDSPSNEELGRRVREIYKGRY